MSNEWKRLRTTAYPIKSYISFFKALMELFKEEDETKKLHPKDYIYWQEQFRTLPSAIQGAIKLSEDIDDNPTQAYKMKLVNEYMGSMLDIGNINQLNSINITEVEIQDVKYEGRRMLPQHARAMAKLSPSIQNYINSTSNQCTNFYKAWMTKIVGSSEQIDQASGSIMVTDETYLDTAFQSITNIVTDLSESLEECIQFLDYRRNYNPMDYDNCNVFIGTDTKGTPVDNCGASQLDIHLGNHIQPDKKADKFEVTSKLDPEIASAPPNKCEAAKISKK